MKKRALSILISFAMIFSMLPSAAFATELPETETEEVIQEMESEETMMETETSETEASEIETEAPEIETELPEIETELPEIETETPVIETEIPVIETETPVIETELPETETEIPETEMISEEEEETQDQILTYGVIGKHVNFAFDKSTGLLHIYGAGETYSYKAYESPFSADDFKKAIKKIEIDEDITGIGDYLFYDVQATSVDLPTSLEKIGFYAFGLSSITSISFSNNLQEIGQYAFVHSSLTEITIPSSVTTLGDDFVSADISKITVAAGNNNFYVKDGVLIDKNQKRIIATSTSVPTSYVMPNDIVSVGCDAFALNRDIEEIQFSTNLKSIDECAFRYCSSLERLDLPESLEWIGMQAFYECTSIFYIDLPDGIQKIGNKAFDSAIIEWVRIPSSLTVYNDWFPNCEMLGVLDLPRSITKMIVSDIRCLEFHYGGPEEEWEAMVNEIWDSNAKTYIKSRPTSYGYGLNISDSSYEHGKVIKSKKRVYDNDSIMIGVNPDAGYLVESVSAFPLSYKMTDNGDNTYTFTNVHADEFNDFALDVDVSYKSVPILSGAITITSGTCYGTLISLGFSSELSSLNDKGLLERKWQVLKNGVWYNVDTVSNYGTIENGRLKPGSGLIGKTIRLKVTADNYSGFVASKSAVVGKASEWSTVNVPPISYSSPYIRVSLTTTDAKKLEYVILPQGTALTADHWNNAIKGNSTSSSYLSISKDATGASLTSNAYYAVYARYFETSTTNAGVLSSYRIVYTGTVVNLPESALNLKYNNVVYPSGSTIYIDVDSLVTPTNANPVITFGIEMAAANVTAWRQSTWTNSNSAAAVLQSVGSYYPSDTSTNVVVPDSASNTTFPSQMKLKYTGTGATTIGAYNWSNGQTIYGLWYLRFYKGTNLQASDIAFAPTYISDQTVSRGQTAVFDAIDTLTMKPENSTYLYRWYEGYITKTSYGSPAFTKADNEYIDVDYESGAVTGLNATDDTSLSKSAMRLYLYNVNTGAETATNIFFKVNVEDADIPAEDLDGLPSERKLNPQEKMQLSVNVYPADSAETVRWTSTDTSVATVASDGTVTAVGSGDCLIYASIGAKKISCKIHVNMEVQICVNNATVTYNGEKTNFFCEGQTATIEATDKENFCKWEVIEGSLDNVYGSKIQYVVGTEHLTLTAVSHTVANQRYVAPTCTEAGHTGGKSCSVCKKVLEKPTVIPATGHTEGESVDEVIKAATYTEAGITDKVSYCTECNEEVFRCSVDVPKLTMSAPVLSKVANAVDGVTITWKATEGAAKYRVYKKVSGGSFSAVSYVTGTSYTDKKAVNGTTYYYTVKPVAADGTIVNSYNKTGLKIKYLKSILTSEYTITNGTNYIAVKWQKNTASTGYLVYRKTGSGSYVKVATIKDNATVTYKDSDVKNGVLYTYLVRPTGGTHTVASQGAKVIRLTTPSIKSLTNSSAGALKVTLTAANTKASGYQIEYSVSSSFSSSKKVNITSNATLTKTLTSLTKGKTYYVRVRSYKKYDGATYYSAWSAKKSIAITK